MKIEYFWNKLLGNIMLVCAVYALVAALGAGQFKDDPATGKIYDPLNAIYALQCLVITGGVWVTKVIWE